MDSLFAEEDMDRAVAMVYIRRTPNIVNDAFGWEGTTKNERFPCCKRYRDERHRIAHVRTYKHIANLCGVDAAELRSAYEERFPKERFQRKFGRRKRRESNV